MTVHTRAPQMPRQDGAPAARPELRVADPAPAARDRDAGPGTPPAEAAMPAAPAKRRPPVAGIVIGLLALVLVGLGARQLAFGRHHVVTDNAQVEGHIVPVLARVSGYVTEVDAVENVAVRSGATLVVLDDRDYRAKLAQGQADLAAAIATGGASGRAGQAQAQLAAARAAVNQAEANDTRARADLERVRALAPRGIVSSQQLDGSEAAASAAAAQLQAARDQVVAAEAGLRNAGARVASAQASLDQAALQLSYTRIVAPSDGVVSRKNVEVGQLVQPGQPLMSVVPLDDVWVVANFKETEIRNVTPGDRATIEVDSYPGRRFAGKVESLSPATGARFSLLPPDNATGNFTKVVQRIPVRIRLDGAQDPAHPLRPGMSVKATVTTS
jgi:membrane fusion protein, multidrug efflux system